MTTQPCSCGRPLLDQKSQSTPTTCPHYSHPNPQRFTLPDRPQSTGTPPPQTLRAPTTHPSPRRSMDSHTTYDPPYHRSGSTTSTSSSSSGSASPAHQPPTKSTPTLPSEPRRSSSVDMAYAPIAAGFARLSRKERDAAALKARAERAVGLDAGRMFAGAA